LGVELNSRSFSRRQKDWIISIGIAALGIGILVGNAYMVCNVGYPSGFQGIGEWIMIGSLVFAVLPSLPLLALSALGIDLPLQGRESFIESNIWLWIYCAVVYTCLIFLFLQFMRRVKQRRSERRQMIGSV
jgi:hypothetical protein